MRMFFLFSQTLLSFVHSTGRKMSAFLLRRSRCVCAAKKYLDAASAPPQAKEWRKVQLEKLESRLSEKPSTASSSWSSTLPPPLQIGSDEELQQTWRDLESRIRNRRPLSLQDRRGVSGRSNVRRTDEDVWLEEGLYDNEAEAPNVTK
jgi:hypothetical protein